MISADASSPYTEGSLHYDLALNKLFVKMGSAGGAGFYQIAAISNVTPTISSPSAGASFVLNSDGTATTVSITATDNDVGQTLTYYYLVSSGSVGSGTTITTSATASGTYSSSGNAVAGSSNASTNSHFRITPSTSVETSFSLTFYVTDNTNTASRTCSFTLAFIVLNSKFTRLLVSTDSASTGGGGNQTITDTPRSGASAKTITSYGSTFKTISNTFSPYRHAGYSVYFDGSDGLSIPAHSSHQIGTNDFTVEFFVYFNSVSSDVTFVGRGDSGQTVDLFIQYRPSLSNDLRVNTDTSYSPHTFSWTPSTSTWYHVSITRSGSDLKAFVDGSQIGSTATDSNSISLSRSVGIGYNINNAGQFFNGYMADVRLVNGTAITPSSGGPTERLAAVSNTAFLTCHLPYVKDGSTNNHTITLVGDPAIEPISPHDNGEYSESKHGGSVFFDGNDYLTIDDHADFDMTGDFTIKFWAYHTDLTISGGQRYTLFDNYYFNSGGLSLSIMGQYSGKVVLYWMNGGSLSVEQLNFIPKVNQWYFYELTRSSNSLTIKVNGDTIDTINVTNLANPNRSLLIGVNTSGSSGIDNGYLKGYISDFQYVTGTTASESSVPTELMATHSSSALHIKGTDAAILDKSQKEYLTLYGAANSTDVLTSSSTPPYIGAAWQNTSAIALLQSSSSDYIYAQNIDLSDEPFTIETWVYQTDQSGADVLFDFRPNGSSSGNYLIFLLKMVYQNCKHQALSATPLCQQIHGTTLVSQKIPLIILECMSMGQKLHRQPTA